jgi:hypothetical protein
MSQRKLSIGLGLIMGILAVAPAWAAGPARTIVVLPARQRLVEFAFQLERWRSVGLVAYQRNLKGDAPLMHVWNGRDWVRIAPDDFTTGAFLAGTPRETIVIGTDADLPPVAKEDPAWSPVVRRIATLDVASVVNSLDSSFRFSPAEWRVLARKFELTLQDDNAAHRRYGRFGGQPPPPAPGPGVTVFADPEPLPSAPAPVLAPPETMPPPVLVEKALRPEAPATPAPETKPPAAKAPAAPAHASPPPAEVPTPADK